MPPNLCQYLGELPKTLDETYNQILKGINKAQKGNAHRLLQCLAIAVQPLLVEELVELLAFNFQATSLGGGPTLKEDWWWDDEEEAVLSTCSSLITIIPHADSQVVQFSHFSVKEYLTSPHLTWSPHSDVSRFRIDIEPVHTIMEQACLVTLLQLNDHAGNGNTKLSLVKYAAKHWLDHAQFGKVPLRVWAQMDDLFDISKPHFASWLQVHNMDQKWYNFSPHSQDGVSSLLYYATFCGFYDMAEHLITKHPEQVQAHGGHNIFPLQAALYNRHLHVADLLYQHGVAVDVQGIYGNTPLCAASSNGQVNHLEKPKCLIFPVDAEFTNSLPKSSKFNKLLSVL